MQTLIWALAVSAGMRGPPVGKPSRALVLRSRWRLRSTSTRRRARVARTLSRLAVIAGAGRLAVAAPALVVVMTARRAAVNEISAGVDGLAGALALAGGDGDGRGGAGCRAGQLDGGDPGGVFLGDEGWAGGAEHRPGGRAGAADRGLGFLQAGFRPGPPPVVSGGEHLRRVGVMVEEVSDQAEQHRGVPPGDGDVILDHADGEGDAAAGQGGQVGAVGLEAAGWRQGDAVLDADQHVRAGREHPLDAGSSRKIPVHDPHPAAGEQVRVVLQGLVQQLLLRFSLLPFAAGRGA